MSLSSIKTSIRHSATNPRFLRSNSTSHKWIFGAVAELVDNSVDAKASIFSVDVEGLTNEKISSSLSSVNCLSKEAPVDQPLSECSIKEEQISNSEHINTIFSSEKATNLQDVLDPDSNFTCNRHRYAGLEGGVRLIFTDNGLGMSPVHMMKMLSFGYCDKGSNEIDGDQFIGQYGNGFKSGSMRLAKDALVFSKHGNTMSIGFLSQVTPFYE